MAISKTYSIGTDCPNGRVDLTALSEEVRESAVKVALDYISTDDDDCTIFFKADLDAADITALDAVVAAHQGDSPEAFADPVVLCDSTGGVLPMTPEGRLVTAPTFEDTGGFQPKWAGSLYTVQAGATSIFDELVDTERQIRGGWYEILAGPPIIGDYIEFAVVDKDDTLGLFSTYGLPVGTDVLELQKYVVKEYINPSAVGRQLFLANSVWPLIAGLYMRTIVVSTGSDDISLKVVTFAYESR